MRYGFLNIFQRLALAVTLVFLNFHRAHAEPVGIQSSPTLTQPLNEFKHLSEKDLLAAYGIPFDEGYRKAYRALRAHFVGTVLEKARVNRECEKRFAEHPDFGAPTKDNIACLYWKIQKLVKVQRALASEDDDDKKTEKIKPVTFKVKQLDSWKDVQKTLVTLLSNPRDCSVANDRAILMREVEDYLPSPESWSALTALYEASAPCLEPSSPLFETLHLRMALLTLEKGEIIRAGGMLDAALHAVKPTEEYRALFWRGFVEALPYSDGADGLYRFHVNPYWDKLVDKYPLTLHAVVADAALNRDFFTRIRDRSPPRVAQFYGNTWDLYNYTAFIFGLFAAKNEKEGMRRISIYATNRVVPPSFETMLYVAQCHFKAGQNWAGISTIYSGLREYGSSQITIDVLRLLYPQPYKSFVMKMGKIVDPALVYSLMRQESTFNAKAKSPVGAKGLMQVLDSTAKHILKRRHVDLFDPEQNILAGTKFLRQLLRRNSDRPTAALASYNAGPTYVNRWRDRYSTGVTLLFSDLIPFTETRNYVAGLVRNMYWYQVFLNWDKAKDGQFAAHRFGEPGLTAHSLVPQPAAFGINPAAAPHVAVDRSVTDSEL